MELLIDNSRMTVMRFELGTWNANAYVVICKQTGKVALIDAPAGVSTVLQNMESSGPEYIFLTHNHVDHIEGLPEALKRAPAVLALHPADRLNWLAKPPDRFLNDGDVIGLGQLKIEVIHTPGHTPGSVCFKIEDILFSGDTLFPGGPGRTDGPDEFRLIVKSITEKIFPLPDETKVYPGHGDSTVLKKEKAEYAVFSSRPHPDLSGDVIWLNSLT